MKSQITSNKVDEAVTLLREQIETIRINLEILEVLKLNGRIKETDKQYSDILDLDRKNQKSFHEFVLTDIPGLIKAKLVPEKKVLKKTLLDWAADMHLSLSYLDRLIKDYMHQIAGIDQNQKKNIKNRDVKDKRFWKFLDWEKGKTRLFKSFEEPVSCYELKKASDSEEKKENQQ
jgi:hypothetical protein